MDPRQTLEEKLDVPDFIRRLLNLSFDGTPPKTLASDLQQARIWLETYQAACKVESVDLAKRKTVYESSLKEGSGLVKQADLILLQPDIFTSVSRQVAVDACSLYFQAGVRFAVCSRFIKDSYLLCSIDAALTLLSVKLQNVQAITGERKPASRDVDPTV